MIWNQTVTLFHKEIENRQEVWTSQVFRGVSAVTVQKSSPYSIGMEPDNQLIVRIPGKMLLNLAPGDRLLLGEHTAKVDSSDFQKAFLVVSVTDNRRGNGELWHYKVVCQ